MKTVILAVLLLLAVASIVADDTRESGLEFGDTAESDVVSGDTTKSGKSRYGDETFLP